ncbi:MAG: homocysteine S-methyltransferase family protein [Ilumatobacteraceae bacterium]
MSTYRTALPQIHGDLFLTDGGIETSLIFDQGLDLPVFAAYPLLDTDEGRQALRRYMLPYLAIAEDHGVGFVLETPTWRANADWGAQLGHDAAELDRVNRDAIAFAVATRNEGHVSGPVVISGTIGPRGDGYVVEQVMTPAEAAAYHGAQIGTFADTDADLVTAMTMTTAAEATGVVLAAKQHSMPVVIGFTVETDGRLPSGEQLGDAIQAVDAATDSWCAYYMINCAHPTHFVDVLDPEQPWTARIRSVRANASTMSHDELNEAEELDAGDMHDLADRYASLRRRLPRINVLGGCCGTDQRHIAAIASAVAAG